MNFFERSFVLLLINMFVVLSAKVCDIILSHPFIFIPKECVFYYNGSVQLSFLRGTVQALNYHQT